MTHNFLGNPFGMNVKIPERTMQQVAETSKKLVNGWLNPFGEVYEQNKQVYSGDIYNEIMKFEQLNFNIGQQLRKADKNSDVSFDQKA